MDKYNSEAIFFIPGAFTKSISMLRTLVNFRDRGLIKDNAKMGCFYGAPYCKWNGGHVVDKRFYKSRDELIGYRKLAEDSGIPIRFTFTNKLIKDDLINDEYCNEILEIFNTGTNEIIFGTPELEEYIRDKYGDRYSYISSTTTSQSDEVKFNELSSGKYKYVVMDMDQNKNFDLLNSIENKESIELIVNSPCMDNCPNQALHYMITSKAQLGLMKDQDYPFLCNSKDGTLECRLSFKHGISETDINNIYLPMSINHFKLEGRTCILSYWVDNIAYYVFKEEAGEELRDILYNLTASITVELMK